MRAKYQSYFEIATIPILFLQVRPVTKLVIPAEAGIQMPTLSGYLK